MLTSLFCQLIDTQHGPKLATMLVLGQFLNVLMDLLAVQLSTMRANFRALPSDTFVPLVLKAMPFEIVQQHWADPDHSEGALASPPIDSYDLTCPPRWQHTQARIAELFKRSSSFSPLAGDLAKHWYQSMKAFDGLGSVVILDSEFAAFSGLFGGKSFYIVPQCHNVAYSSKSVAFQNNQFYALVSHPTRRLAHPAVVSIAPKNVPWGARVAVQHVVSSTAPCSLSGCQRSSWSRSGPRQR